MTAITMSDVVGRGQTTGRRRGFRLLSLVWLVAGLLLSVALSAFVAFFGFQQIIAPDFRPMLAVSLVSFVAAAAIIRYVRRFALVNLWAILIWSVIGSGLATIFVLSVANWSYSLVYLGCFDAIMFLVLAIWVLMIHKIQYLRLALVPSGLAIEVLRTSHPQLAYQVLSTPAEVDHDSKLNGVVVDVDSPLDEQWVRAISEWSAGQLRIYRAAELFEAITGRVSLKRISAGIVADITGNPGYELMKRLLDIVGVMIASPFALLVTAATAIVVRIESPGPAIFSQQRTGRGGRPFTAYKIRSMFHDSERDGPKFAAKNDKRVTHVGSFIRKYRIDELPQLWNVFRGEMSLIGPRPEQPKFVSQFTRDIPFYPYRHSVRPGLTGWAQVHQGYVGDTESTWEKLEYDLYYIKHFSFWLDLLVVFKTARTVLTGFGAR